VDFGFDEAAPSDGGPDPAQLARAAGLLDSARRPLLYLGLGAAPARADIVALAERLEAPVATTIQGKGVFPERHPLSLWPGFGDAAPPFAREIAASCDATLAIGCRFGEVATASYGVTPPTPLIHVDIDPTVPGANYKTDLAIVADAAATISGLLPRLAARPVDQELRRAIAAGHTAVRQQWDRAAGSGVAPHRLLRALQERFGPETIFTSDSGNGTFWAMEALELDAPGKLLAPIDYSCMGYAVPAAIGARLACPATPVVCLAGDGAFLMTGLELLTAAQLGLAVAVFVLRDRELAQIAQFQEIALNRKTCSILPDYDLAALCRGVGIECIGLRDDAGLPAVLERVERSLAAGQPVVVDVAIDYSTKTYFTRGVVKTNLGRLSWRDRLRLVARALARRVLG
jgi:acetolactate synthase-1/2/3 large subunit